MEAESLYSRGFSGSSLSDSAWLSQADFRRLLPVCCPGWTTAVGTLRRRQPLPAAGRDAVDGARHRSRPRRQGLRVVHRVPAVRRRGDHDDDRERCPRRLARRHDRRAAGVRFHGRQSPQAYGRTTARRARRRRNMFAVGLSAGASEPKDRPGAFLSPVRPRRHGKLSHQDDQRPPRPRRLQPAVSSSSGRSAFPGTEREGGRGFSLGLSEHYGGGGKKLHERLNDRDYWSRCLFSTLDYFADLLGEGGCLVEEGLVL